MGSPLSVAIDDTDSVTLDFPDSQSFTVEYGVVNPASVGNINYQVKLVGVDKEWRNVGRSRQFTGMGLRPGSYTLLIRAEAGRSARVCVRIVLIRCGKMS